MWSTTTPRRRPTTGHNNRVSQRRSEGVFFAGSVLDLSARKGVFVGTRFQGGWRGGQRLLRRACQRRNAWEKPRQPSQCPMQSLLRGSIAVPIAAASGHGRRRMEQNPADPDTAATPHCLTSGKWPTRRREGVDLKEDLQSRFYCQDGRRRGR